MGEGIERWGLIMVPDEAAERYLNPAGDSRIPDVTFDLEEAIAAVSEGFCPRRCASRLERVMGWLGCPACRSLWRVKGCDCGHHPTIEEARLQDMLSVVIGEEP